MAFLLFQHTYIPILKSKNDYLSEGRLVLKWHLLLHKGQAAFQLLDQPEVDLYACSCINQFQHYYT